MGGRRGMQLCNTHAFLHFQTAEAKLFCFKLNIFYSTFEKLQQKLSIYNKSNN